MVIEVIERECVAKVGLSTQLTNEEIESVVQVVRTVDKAIEDGCEELKKARMPENKKEYTEADKLAVKIDLSTLIRIHWLLDTITDHRATKPSNLFNDADIAYSHTLCEINKKGE